MNETKKTGIFWGVAGVVALLSVVITWPTTSVDVETSWEDLVGLPLFGDFKDPLAAASMKIVTFDEEQGTLQNFEVRKDSQSGLWTIPSKGGYPADAVQQMRNAANSLVGVNVLDVPTDNAEDHSGMGVLEPNLEELSVGDEGVGRLVTFKDSSQNVLASLIVGKTVKEQEGQVYVRKPGQDPVYVVSLDDSPLTTKFQDWIEDDLLQLSSIDVQDVVLKDYSASRSIRGFAWERNSEIELTKEGTEWKLTALREYDPKAPTAPPKIVEVDAEKPLNAQKLNELVGALDDLKFVDVKRKPEGISANLKADKEFANNDQANAELITRGFFPVRIAQDDDPELLSANGELAATTKSGVTYVLRFGNVSGLSEKDDSKDGDEAAEDESSTDSTGVNRYLMVSTTVDESFFPVPELTPIPQTLEDLEALDKPAPPEGTEFLPDTQEPSEEMTEKPAESAGESQPADGDSADGDSADGDSADGDAAEEMTEDAGTESATGDQPESKEDAPRSDATDPETSDPEPAETDKPETDPKADPATEKAGEEANSGEANVSGEGTSEGSGGGQQEGTTTEEPAESEDKTDAKAEEASDADGDDDQEMADAETPQDDVVEETEEEKQERLAAMQEKITKENERKLEDRKERLENARRQSRALNERFADWYYVIPEETYSKLRIDQESLYQTEDAAAAPTMPGGMPPGMQFQIPGMGR
ncbi:MAG: hypothetical protein AAFV88_13770 [Planctomycetota bacterium]